MGSVLRIAAFLGIGSLAHGAIAFVNSSTGGWGGANCGTSGTINMAGANFFLVSVSYFGTTPPASVPTDSSSNSYTALTNENNGSTGLIRYFAQGASSTSTMTFTVSCSSLFAGITVLGFSGVAATGALQAGTDVGATFASAQASLATGSISYTANSLIITSALSTSASDSLTVTGPPTYTAQDHIAFNSGVTEGNWIDYSIQASSGSTNPSWATFNGANGAAAVAAFSASAGGGSTCLHNLLLTMVGCVAFTPAHTNLVGGVPTGPMYPGVLEANDDTDLGSPALSCEFTGDYSPASQVTALCTNNGITLPAFTFPQLSPGESTTWALNAKLNNIALILTWLASGIMVEASVHGAGPPTIGVF